MPERPATTVARWNKAHPVGTPVRVWPGVREGDGTLTRTRSAAEVLGGHTAVVWVDGEGACIALSHVDPDHTDRLPALAVACPTCGSQPGQLCTSHSGICPRRHDVHQTRTAAHKAQQTRSTQ
ncbi:zinc finger domain-containing protein [Streptomyces sp. NPDC001515]